MMGAGERAAGQKPTAAGVVLEAATADDAEPRVAVAAHAFGELPNVAAHVVTAIRAAAFGK